LSVPNADPISTLRAEFTNALKFEPNHRALPMRRLAACHKRFALLLAILKAGSQQECGGAAHRLLRASQGRAVRIA
jgi:hypothetical protein